MSILKLLDSRAARVLLVSGGYIAAIGILCALSEGAWYYLYRMLSFWIEIPPDIAFGMGIAVLLLYGISRWRTAAQEGVLRRVDASSLLLFIGSGIFIGVCLLENERQLRGPMLLAISAVLYTGGVLVYGELVCRLRLGTLLSGLAWVGFFKRFPPARGIGFRMLFLLAVSWLCLLMTLPLGHDHQSGTLVTALFTVVIAVLTALARRLCALSAEYEAASADKLRAERFKTELITNVSHDIRTPMTSLISYVDLLRRLPIQNEDFWQYTEVLEAKAARLNALIDDLMQASKAGTGNLPVTLEAVPLPEIVGQIAGELDELFAARGLELILRVPEEMPPAFADSAHLWRVLENLFGNAAKYAMPGTRVFAELSETEDGLVVALKNTSEAMLTLAADELTEQFIRGDRARRTEGSGLGLYIAKSLTELMGGRLSVAVSGDLFTAEVRLSVSKMGLKQ